MPASLVAVPTGLAPTARRPAGIRSCSRRCGPTIRAISPCRSLTRRARNELDDPDVQAKAAAATKWCKTANAYTDAGKSKPWSYALVPDDQIAGAATLGGLISRFGL